MAEDVEYLYVILDSMGKCLEVSDSGTMKVDGLPSLLRGGWRPVRETPFSGSSNVYSHVLILLERDARDSSNFGFKP